MYDIKREVVKDGISPENLGEVMEADLAKVHQNKIDKAIREQEEAEAKEQETKREKMREKFERQKVKVEKAKEMAAAEFKKGCYAEAVTLYK